MQTNYIINNDCNVYNKQIANYYLLTHQIYKKMPFPKLS